MNTPVDKSKWKRSIVVTVGGQKTTPSSPTYVDFRDALNLPRNKGIREQLRRYLKLSKDQGGLFGTREYFDRRLTQFEEKMRKLISNRGLADDVIGSIPKEFHLRPRNPVKEIQGIAERWWALECGKRSLTRDESESLEIAEALKKRFCLQHQKDILPILDAKLRGAERLRSKLLQIFGLPDSTINDSIIGAVMHAPPPANQEAATTESFAVLDRLMKRFKLDDRRGIIGAVDELLGEREELEEVLSGVDVGELIPKAQSLVEQYDEYQGLLNRVHLAVMGTYSNGTRAEAVAKVESLTFKSRGDSGVLDGIAKILGFKGDEVPRDSIVKAVGELLDEKRDAELLDLIPRAYRVEPRDLAAEIPRICNGQVLQEIADARILTRHLKSRLEVETIDAVRDTVEDLLEYKGRNLSSDVQARVEHEALIAIGKICGLVEAADVPTNTIVRVVQDSMGERRRLKEAIVDAKLDHEALMGIGRMLGIEDPEKVLRQDITHSVQKVVDTLLRLKRSRVDIFAEIQDLRNENARDAADLLAKVEDLGLAEETLTALVREFAGKGLFPPIKDIEVKYADGELAPDLDKLLETSRRYDEALRFSEAHNHAELVAVIGSAKPNAEFMEKLYEMLGPYETRADLLKELKGLDAKAKEKTIGPDPRVPVRAMRQALRALNIVYTNLFEYRPIPKSGTCFGTGSETVEITGEIILALLAEVSTGKRMLEEALERATGEEKTDEVPE